MPSPHSARYDPGMTLRLLLSLFAYALLTIASPASEPVFPPGSRVGLVPPAGMIPSSDFQGFEDRARGAMLVVSELSVQSFDRMMKEFSPEQMRAGGME